MFGLFRNKNSPRFKTLESFLERDFYFVRMAPWDHIDAHNIVVFDPHSSKILTLDPWPQLIFNAANGKRTVSEFVHHLAGQYGKKIPAQLDRTIIQEILKLLEDGLIAFSRYPGRPLPEFEFAKGDRK